MKTWMSGALAVVAIAAGGAAQAATISVTTTPPAPNYVTLSNSGAWGTVSSYSHNILSVAQESNFSAFLSANSLGQSGSLSLYFSDDEGDGRRGNQDLEYFQYNLNGAGWVGTLTSAYEVDGAICYSGNLNNAACKAGYFGFGINLNGGQLSSLLSASGVPTVQVRVNPNYNFPQDFYFKGSILNAQGSTRSVPEPATLGLLGLGLIGVGFARRRRNSIAS